MNLRTAFTLLLLPLLFLHCRHDDFKSTEPDPINPQPIQANIQGFVFDETGMPAAGVQVKTGSKNTVTDPRGYFRFTNASLDKTVSLVTAEKPGYYKAFRSFGATEGTNQVVLQMIKKSLAGNISGSAGGSVTLSDGTKIQLPANSVVKKHDGSVYLGSISVYANYIDPTGDSIGMQVPGSFTALDRNGSRSVLLSYGMVAVELLSSLGEPLQMKSGTSATLTVPIPASIQSNAPATIPLWYLDETTGIWKEEGAATRQANAYLGTVQHFSYWNCDGGFPAAQISMTLKLANGQPLVNGQTRIRQQGPYGTVTYGWTDSLGKVGGLVPAQEVLVLEVLDPCLQVIHSQNIGPFTQTTDLGVITLTNPANSIYTITGHLSNCSGGNVANGFAVVWFSNQVHYATTDAQGNFTASFPVCSGATGMVSIYGFDLSTQQQGPTFTSVVSSPVTNTGSHPACGTTATEFIHYTLDNVHFQMNDLNPSDSMVALTTPTGGVVISYFVATKQPQPDDIIAFSFQQPAASTTGSYPLTMLHIQEYPSTGVVLYQPIMVNVTQYPTVVGQYHEGNFAGQFKDLNQVVHTVSCTYRVKKLQ